MREQEIQDLINQDYLQFCLHYTLEDTKLSFELANGTKVNLLGDGLIGFNVEDNSQSHHQHKPSKSIILSCAVHGNETAPIEICNQLIHELLHNKLQTHHRVLFIFGNIPSMHIQQRFVEENLNRLFSRAVHSTAQEGDRAIEIMDAVDTFFSAQGGEKLHYDLHTAIRASKNEKFAVYPYLHGKEHDKKQLRFLSSCGVNTILLSQSATTTFSYYSSFNHQAHAFTVELGKVKPFGQNDMSSFTDVNAALRSLLAQQSPVLPDYHQCPLEIFTVNQVIIKQKDDFRLHFGDDTANFTEFSKGDLLASETGASYFASQDKEAIVFPNANVAIGQRAILTVVPYEL
jgi:succinylglutamate desuccinylase